MGQLSQVDRMTRRGSEYSHYFPSGSAVTMQREWDVWDPIAVVNEIEVRVRVTNSQNLEFVVPAGLVVGSASVRVRSAGADSNRLNFIVP